jgi:hypothetical protein
VAAFRLFAALLAWRESAESLAEFFGSFFIAFMRARPLRVEPSL